MPCPRGAGVRFLILLLSLSCFFATCIICVVVVQSWCLHGGGCCCFHFCSCCPFRCSLSELLAPFKLLSMMVVGGTSRGASGALDGELVMISRCPRPGASSYIVLLLVICLYAYVSVWYEIYVLGCTLVYVYRKIYSKSKTEVTAQNFKDQESNPKQDTNWIWKNTQIDLCQPQVESHTATAVD